MLQFDATRLFKLRGIKKPYAFLCKQGLSHHIAQRLAAGSVNTLKLGYLETVCMALHCTPNDLMCWTPDEQYPLPDDHPLHALKQGQGMDMLLELKDLPLEKVSQLRDFLKELKE